tara:strand:- start:119 stop:649 length:531 start_codon:yes stop_codon:yes gene_type:complete
MSKLYGVPDGLLIGQHSRVDELNDRIVERQFSDKPLAPNFSPIPTMTKYSHFPALDRKAPTSVSIQPSLEHNVQTNFSPATQNGPPQTYLRNVDMESSLRNQTVALQRGITQGVYVPSSQSDLYKVQVPSKPGPQPHKNLFEKSSFAQTAREQNTQQSSIGKELFYNHTRVQLRGL